MIVFQFAQKDVAELEALGSVMHQESGYRDQEFDSRAIADLAARVLAFPEFMCAFLVRDELNQVAGFFVGHVAVNYFNRRKSAYDLLLFVPPDRRGGYAAVKLIRAYENWSRKRGASEIYLGVTTGVEEERTVNFYERLGYQKTGTLLKKKA